MSDAPNRLSAPAGSRIDRARQIRFTFDGRAYEGYAGDTVASALAAHGVFLLSRSFKYHRPRGSLGFAGEEAGALVQVGDDPNVLADVRTLAPGLDVRGQNYVGSLRGDWAAALGLVRRFLPVGFYYKAFYRPKGIWKYWERVIRASAGLGRINPHAPHGAFDHAHDFCDVAVIGGGPAGLTAALEAAQAGAEVLLVEREPAVGGALSYARFDPAGARAAVELDALVKRVGPHRNLRIMTRATCTGYFADNWLAVTQGNRLTKVRAAAVVVATGCLDQPAVFRHNDLPGILLASGVQRLLRLYGVAPGRRIVVLTASDDGYASALDLAEHQLELAAIVDLRPQGPPGPFERAAGVRGLRTLHRHTVREAIRRPDGQRLGAVRVTHITGPGHCAPTGDELACDALCVATGAAPAASLLWQAGATFAYDETSATLALRSIPPGVFAAGSVAGHHALDAVLADGRRAGWAAAARAGFERALEPPAAASGPAGAQAPPRPIFPHPGGHDYVDLDEDIEAGDIAHAIAEGFTHGELVKRYTGLGMGPSQGRQSALAALQVTAHELGVPIAHVGTTTSRPPAYPEKFGHLAGRGFAPVRHTPLHQRHAEAGAQMMVAGLWIRPAYYGPASEREALIREEVLAVRHNVGLIDVSTLGGYEIRGPAAAEFLERMYTLAYRRQTVGRVRYALMTDEAGVIVDDGVAARLGERHFYLTASTSGAEQLYPRFLWHQAQWRLDVDIADVSAAYGAFNLAGPNARALLRTLTGDLDLAPAAFPYLAVRTGTLAGIPVRVLRLGFVGEVGYEIHAPAAQVEALWDALVAAGLAFGLRRFGVEAQRVLRLEKGHIIVSQDTDGLTHPFEADLAWAVNLDKRFFVGKRAIQIQAASGPTRRLVGFTLRDPKALPPSEGRLIVRGRAITGRVTSSAWSPTLQCSIGMAYVAPDQAEPGHVVQIKGARGRLIDAVVTRLPFYDPDHRRQEV